MPKRKGRRNGSARRRGKALARAGGQTHTRPIAGQYLATAGGAMNNNRFIAGGFPDRSRVRLVYTERVALTTTSGSVGVYRFAGNDVFDPNVTGTGAQPVNADIFTSQYNRCRVHGSRMQVSIRHPADGTIPVDVVMLPMNLTTSLTLEEYEAQPYARSQMAINYGLAAPILETGISSAKILGRTPAAFQGSDLTQSLTTTSPSDLWYWTIAINSTDRSTTGTIYLIVNILYDVEYFDRKAQVLSFEREEGKHEKIPRPVLTKDEVRKQNVATRERQGPATTNDAKGDSKSGQDTKHSTPRWADMDDDDQDEALYNDFARWRAKYAVGAGKAPSAGAAKALAASSPQAPHIGLA